MPPRRDSKFRNNKRRKPEQEEFKRREWLPRGVSITVYDIQGTAISPELVKRISDLVEREVKGANAPSLALDVRTS